MALDDKAKAKIAAAVAPLIGSLATAGLVAGATAIISKLTAVNMKSSTMAGDTEMKPTEDKVGLSNVDVAGMETEGKVMQDKVAGANGDVKGDQMEAKAMTGEATAMESGASALRGKAGAADIETKTLKMT
jgi:hypothetical protein